MPGHCYNEGMNTNLIHDLLGNTFERRQKLIGHDIEVLCGGEVNCRDEADFGTWELKARKNGAVSRISLGGKKDVSYNELVNHVYGKIKNLILVEYDENCDNTFTVTRITILFGLNKEVFESGNYFEVENHHRNCTIRTTETKLYKMFGTKNIRYETPEWARS